MPIYYCTACAKDIAYEAIKPKSCPKCFCVFAASPKAVPVPLPPTPHIPNDEDDDDEGEELPDNARASRRTLRRPQKKPLAQYRDEEIDPEDAAAGVETDPFDDGNRSDNYDPREVRRRARQLKASINWSIRPVEPTEKSVKFGDWCGTKKEE